ncbi:MAG: hypothetical protein FJX11_25850 [Alphaproteobacteria bacterium]|nr:hypothetical protein [Alphaproteobacteria bacterium]
MTLLVPGVEWMAAGTVGAALCFVCFPWPAVGDRMRNFAIAITVALGSGILTVVVPQAWRSGAAWFVTMVLLQWSHEIVSAGRHAGLRAAVAAAAVFAGVSVLWR